MGQLVFQATLGGQVNLVGPNTASTFNINVPAVAGNMVTTGDTGTVTNTMLAGSIDNTKLSNSAVTIGSTSVSLGSTAATIAGLTLTTPNIGAATGTSLAATAGLYSSGTYAGSYTDGIVVDYTTGTGRITVGTSDGLKIRNGGTSSPVDLVTVDSSGSVGIGTSSLSAKLVVYDASTSIVKIATSASGTASTDGFDLLSAGTTAYVYNRENGPMLFATNNTEAGRFDASGRLLVGTTTSPSNTGGVIVSNNELFVYNIPTTAGGANCNISSGEGNRFYRSTSALKYKQDIRDIESIDIGLFRPVRYKSKCENDDQTKDHFGFIADEAADAGFEELVSRGVDNEIEGFQYDRMTVILVKALQDQKAVINQLQADLATLKAPQ